jgi:hypothetical protein
MPLILMGQVTPGPLIDDQARNELVRNEVGLTENTEGMDKFPIPGSARFRMGQVTLRRLLSILFIVACSIAFGLVLAGSERNIVGALVPGTQEWLHYHFFHLPKGHGQT